MKLDAYARRDFYKQIWKMFVIYATKISVVYHERAVVITVHTKEPVDVDGAMHTTITDWNTFTETPPIKDET